MDCVTSSYSFSKKSAKKYCKNHPHIGKHMCSKWSQQKSAEIPSVVHLHPEQSQQDQGTQFPSLRYRGAIVMLLIRSYKSIKYFDYTFLALFLFPSSFLFDFLSDILRGWKILRLQTVSLHQTCCQTKGSSTVLIVLMRGLIFIVDKAWSSIF